VGADMAKQSTYHIVIPVGMKPRPKIHEETAADILADHFKSDVYLSNLPVKIRLMCPLRGSNGK
jgi:hypothetical protein